MVGPAPFKPYTFAALRNIYKELWVRCDSCRRYAPLRMAAMLDVDYRRRTFSCSRCGADGAICIIEPIQEYGMADYRFDPVADPQHHPAAARRLIEPPLRPSAPDRPFGWKKPAR